MQVWALVDCLRRRPDAFVAAGKMTKQRWTIITRGRHGDRLPLAAGGFLGPLGFLNIAAFVAAAVYHVDVKPALQRVQGGGRGTSNGPYGPW